MLHFCFFVCITLVDFIVAPVAELVDAADLKSVDRKVVPVQVRPGAPYSKKDPNGSFFMPQNVYPLVISVHYPIIRLDI